MKIPIRIPKSFDLYAQTINITWHDDLILRNDARGEAHQRYNQIKMDTMVGRPESMKEQTFYHEKVHLILHQMGEEELANNEKFVDTFASLLHQADASAEYDD